MIASNDTALIETLETIPHAQEAEQALIGALLYDNEVYHQVEGLVKPDHFYNPVHRQIYESIGGLIMSGRLADAIVLKNRFSQDETLAEIGGVEYLALLLDNAATSASATEYAKLIFDMAMRRELIRLGQDMTARASDLISEAEPSQQITEAEGALFNLAEIGGTQKGFVGFQEALRQSIEMANAAFARDGSLSGMSTGLADLDAQLGGLHSSDLIILAGRPSMGKSALAANIGFHIAKKFKAGATETGVKKAEESGVGALFSLEMSAEQLATRLLAEQSGISSFRIRRGDITREQYERVREAATEINQIPLFIDDTGGLSIGALAARCRRLKRIHGLDLIIVDYLQLLTGGGQMRSNDNRVQEVSLITQQLKALAKELNVPVLALAQLSRAVEQRDDKKPMLSDLRESGSIEQDADVVCFVFRKSYYLSRSEPDEGTEDHMKWQDEMAKWERVAEVIVGKQRHGPIGTVALSFEAEITKFGNLAPEDKPGYVHIE